MELHHLLGSLIHIGNIEKKDDDGLPMSRLQLFNSIAHLNINDLTMTCLSDFDRMSN